MLALLLLTLMEPSSTDLAPSNGYDLSRMEGRHTVIWPYSRSYYGRDLPYKLWSLIEKEDAIKLIFSEVPGDPEKKKAHGDLAHFIAHFADPSRILLIASDHSGEIAGITWFDVQMPNYRALGNVWFRRKFWGEAAREAGVMSLDYMFHVVGTQHIWGYTPWLTAVKYCLAIGFNHTTTLPGYALCNGKSRDMHIVHCAKDGFRRES